MYVYKNIDLSGVSTETNIVHSTQNLDTGSVGLDLTRYVSGSISSSHWSSIQVLYYTSGSPVLEDTEEAFSAAIENRDITTMENLIKDLENRNRPDEVKLYKDRLEQFKEDEANLSAEEFTKRALEEADDTESDKIIDFQVDKPSFRKEYKDILSRSEWSNLSEDKVRVIYKLIDEGKYKKPKKEEPKQEERKPLTTEGLSESDAAVVDKINTALGLS